MSQSCWAKGTAHFNPRQLQHRDKTCCRSRGRFQQRRQARLGSSQCRRVPDYTDSSVSVLLGNGDGTFQTALNFRAGTNPISVATGDFNGDGKPDWRWPIMGRIRVPALPVTFRCSWVRAMEPFEPPSITAPEPSWIRCDGRLQWRWQGRFSCCQLQLHERFDTVG